MTKKLGAEDSAEEIFIEHSDNIFPNEWIDGGNTFVYNALFPDTASDLLARHNDGTSTVLMRDESDTWASSFTSDEEWVAYVYDNSVYVSKYPDFSIRWLVSSGMFPRWGNGQSLYFMNGANLSAVDVTFTPSVSFSNPYHVAELGITGFLTKRFDVDDSGRIVYTKVANTPQSPVLVRNFLAEIE